MTRKEEGGNATNDFTEEGLRGEWKPTENDE